MNRMWNTWLAMVATLAVTSLTHGQSNWSQPSEIGSYQSILSQAGYGTSVPAVGMPSAQQPMLQSPVPPAPTGPEVAAPPMATAPMAGSGSRMSTPAPMPGSPAPMMGAQGQIATPGCSNCAPVASYGSTPMTGGGYIGGGMISGPAVSSPVYSSAVAATGCTTPVYTAPVYSAPSLSRTPLLRPRRKANYTLGLFGLAWERDYEDGRRVSANGAGDVLRTSDADHGTLDGFGVNLGARKCDGSGFEAIYWGFNPGNATAGLTGNPFTTISGFNQLQHVPTGLDLVTLYNGALSHTVVRDTDINNVELNLLRNGGSYCTKGGRSGFFEILGGFRWFQFDESLQYLSETDTATFAAYPTNLAYNLQTKNTLLGLQLGARNEICLANRVRLFTSVKGGVFNNNIDTHQNLTDETGLPVNVSAGPAAGRQFDYSDEKNDIAFLGELDLGVLLHLSNRARFRIGYRAIGVSGVALAGDQIPYSFTDPSELLSADSNGGLLLGGAYYGIEVGF